MTAEAEEILETLGGNPEEAVRNWRQWYEVFNDKMTSGDATQVAEVVSDLTHARQANGVITALERMLSSARSRTVTQVAHSLDIDEAEAGEKVDQALRRIEQGGV